jgi:tetratricopeptide (TPR) repeat protein
MTRIVQPRGKRRTVAAKFLVIAPAVIVIALAVIGAVQVKYGVTQDNKSPQSFQASVNRQISTNKEAPPGVLEKEKKQKALHQAAAGYMQMKNWAKASELLQQAIAVAPERAAPPLFSDLAKTLQAQGRSREALAAMRKAFSGRWRGLENHPEDLVRYARIAESVGEPKEASRAYLQAIKVGASLNNDLAESLPANPTRNQVQALALVASGQENRRKGDVAGATKTFRQAVVIDPKCAVAHLNLALLLPSDSEEALAHFNEASRSKNITLRQFALLKAKAASARIRQRQQKSSESL